MEIVIAAGCAGILVAAGLIIAFRFGCQKIASLFTYECEYDDEIYVKDDEDAARVRKHQELRLSAKKMAADEFYSAGGAGGTSPLDDNFQFVCTKCGRVHLVSVLSDGGGGLGDSGAFKGRGRKV